MPKFGTTKIWCIGQLKLEDRGWINKKSAKMSARYPQTYDVSLSHSSPEIISNIENDVNGLTMLQIWCIGQLDSNANQDFMSDLIDFVNTPKFKFCHNLTSVIQNRFFFCKIYKHCDSILVFLIFFFILRDIFSLKF